MTAFALRTTGYHNGVSKKHGEVAREMWRCIWPDLPDQEIPIDHITNGVHVPTWLNPRMEMLYSKYFNLTDPHWQINHDNPEIWQLVDEIPDKELWADHIWLKQKLFNRIRERKRINWENHLKEPGNLIAGRPDAQPFCSHPGICPPFFSLQTGGSDILRSGPSQAHPE